MLNRIKNLKSFKRKGIILGVLVYPLTRVECNIPLPGGLEVSMMSALLPTGAGRVGCLLVRSLRAW